jgi:hypothetical protein
MVDVWHNYNDLLENPINPRIVIFQNLFLWKIECECPIYYSKRTLQDFLTDSIKTSVDCCKAIVSDAWEKVLYFLNLRGFI